MLSQSYKLWDLVHGIVIHLSQLVVSGVEFNPLIIVNINSHVMVGLFSPNVGILAGVHPHLHGKFPNLGQLFFVQLSKFLHLRSWAFLLQGFDELGEGEELFGVHESFNIFFEFLANIFLELMLILLGLSIKIIAMLFETFKLLLVDGVFKHLN